MSMILPGSKCALTDQPINPGDDAFVSSGTFLPKSDPLCQYCDQPILWDVYVQWDQRPKFAAAYVKTWVKTNKKNPFWWCVFLDDNVYISVNPQRGIEEASVRLFDVGTDIRVPLTKWSEWIRDPRSVTPNLHALEYELLGELLPSLREKLPDAHAVVDAIDPDEKKPRKK